MNGIFCGCSSLILLPDISKWNTNNVINMKNIFFGCKSLTFIPNISKWNTSNASDMSFMFTGALTPDLLENLYDYNVISDINAIADNLLSNNLYLLKNIRITCPLIFKKYIY